MVREAKFYKTILAIGIPIALQNLIGFMVNLVDTLMLGRLGEATLSGANLAGQLYFLSILAITGISEGSNVLNSQYFGKKDINSIHKVFSITFRITLGLGILLSCIAFFLPTEFMSIYSTEPEVISEGAKYLKIMTLSYIPYAFTSSHLIMLRSVHSTKISVLTYGCSFLINASLNYVLIFGNFGAPALGIEGAAIATVIARIFEMCVVIFYLLKVDKKVKIRPHHLKKVDGFLFKLYVKTAVPILSNEIIWAMGASFITIIYGRLGKEVVSANVIASVIFQFLSIFLFGVSSSALVMIGNVIGEGKIKKAYEYSKTFVIIGVFLGLTTMGLVFLVKDLAISFYSITDETKLLANDIINATGIILFFQTLTIISGNGSLRGGGDSKTVFILDVIFLWFFAVPLGFLSAFYWELPIFWIFILARSDEMLKAFAFSTRVICFKWVRDLTSNNLQKQEKVIQ